MGVGREGRELGRAIGKWGLGEREGAAISEWNDYQYIIEIFGFLEYTIINN